MHQMRLSKKVSRLLGEPNCNSSITPSQKLTSAYSAAVFVVHTFFVMSLFLVFSMLVTFWLPWRATEAGVSLWPLAWVDWVGYTKAVDLVCWSVLIASLLAVLWPTKGWVRIALFVTIFELIAFTNAFGKINHGWHQWVYVTFFLIFLPGGSWQPTNSHGKKLTFVMVIWVLQLALLLMYSMSGVWKIYAGITQLLQGELHAFHPHALAYLTTDRLLQTNSTSILGPFLADNPLVGWPLFLATIYLETFSILVAFRPSLHRIWGIGLSLFHIGVYLTMSIPFNFSLFILGLFLVLSPFHPKSVPFWHFIQSLPLLGDLIRIVLFCIKPSRERIDDSTV